MSDQIISWIDARIEAIISYPRSFGSDEAIMQILSLLEFRAVTINPERELENFGRVVELYQKYIANAFPQAGVLPLFQIVETNNLGYNLATELRKAVQAQLSKPGYEISFCDLNAIMALISEYETERYKYEN